MDMQSGKLYWPITCRDRRQYPALDEDIDCDVLIIGGGSSGAQAAYYLSGTGLRTVLIDKGRFAGGSTAANTALIQYAGEKSFVSLKNTFGEEQAARHLRRCSDAIREIEALSLEMVDRAGFSRRNSLYYASCSEDVPALKEEHALLVKHGFRVEYWEGKQVSAKYPFSAPAALYYLNDAELNPVAFTLGLLERAEKRGVRLFENTEWSGAVQGEDRVTVYTRDRREIKARHVIVAAGYGNQSIKPDRNAGITSSYAIVTSPVQDFSSWPDRTLIWETARPYLYMRTTPEGRIIIGGLDETTAIARERDRHLPAKRDKLLREFNRRFPDIAVSAEYYLAAFYGGTHDGLPVIGQYEEYPRCTFLTAYGDNGLVYSMVLARIISEMITEGPTSEARVYLPERLMPVL